MTKLYSNIKLIFVCGFILLPFQLQSQTNFRPRLARYEDHSLLAKYVDTSNTELLLSLADSVPHRLHSDVCRFFADKGRIEIIPKVKEGILHSIINPYYSNIPIYLACLYILNDNEALHYAKLAVDSMLYKNRNTISPYGWDDEILTLINFICALGDDTYYDDLIETLESTFILTRDRSDIEIIRGFILKFPEMREQIFEDLMAFGNSTTMEYRRGAISVMRNYKDFPGQQEFLRMKATNDADVQVRLDAIDILIDDYKDYYVLEELRDIIIQFANDNNTERFHFVINIYLTYIISPFTIKTFHEIIDALPEGFYKEDMAGSLNLFGVLYATDGLPSLINDAIDTLRNYTDQSAMLQYLGPPSFAAQLDNYLNSAKISLQSGDSLGCAQYLMLYRNRIGAEYQDSLNQTTDFATFDGWTLLYYVARELIHRLPVWKPDNVQATFPSPQSVTVTWTAEYSPTMLPNGGGYDLYRAIVYDGSTVSFTKLNTSLIATGTYTDNPVIPASIPAEKNVYLKYYLLAKNNQGVFSESSDTLSLFLRPRRE